MREEWKSAASISCNAVILACAMVLLYKMGGNALLSAGVAYGLAGALISQKFASRNGPDEAGLSQRSMEP